MEYITYVRADYDYGKRIPYRRQTTEFEPGQKVAWLFRIEDDNGNPEWLTAVVGVSLKKGLPVRMTQWSDGDRDTWENTDTLQDFLPYDEFLREGGR